MVDKVDKKECVFIVDDNLVNLNSGKAALQNKYTVITMPSGEKLFSSLKMIKPNLILLDIDMPGMNGFEALNEINSNPKTSDIPVIFLTGKANIEDELKGLSLGAVDYITKPFTAAILQKRVGLQLQLQRQKLELREYNDNLEKMVEDRVRDIDILKNAIITWAAEIIEFRDEETGHHTDRVQKYLKILLEAMEETDLYSDEVSTWDINAFLKSTPLHDVGKIKINDAILLKNSSLTNEEIGEMQLHTIYGKKLLESLQSKVPDQVFLEYAKTLALSHHERWDGTGYPEGLEGEDIPLQARMLAIADVYDALISERSYKEAFSHEKAMDIIAKGKGTQFDPNLTDVFMRFSEKIREASLLIKFTYLNKIETVAMMEGYI